MRARAGTAGGIDLAFGLIDGWGEVESLEAAGRTFAGRLIRAGVPHFVVPIERLEGVPVQEWGAALRHHPRYEPGGANVDFVARLAPGRIAMRTYERGVEGETLACGSGAMAVALWALAEGDRSPISVRTAGGDDLRVNLTARVGRWVTELSGPAEIAYRGEWTESAPVTAPA
jgi:diaminopimelate epimerase